MSAGREMDALIAEKVMGWEVRRDWPCRWIIDGWMCASEENGAIPADEPTLNRPGTDVCYADVVEENFKTFDRVPDFSTSIADAWDVVEKMHARGLVLALYYANGRPEGTRWDASFYGEGAPVSGDAATAPLAICRAALAVPPGGAAHAER